MKDGCIILVILLILIIAVFLLFGSGSGAKIQTFTSNKQSDLHSQQKFVETLITKGYVVIDNDSCHVFIDSTIWDESDISGKQNMAINFAKYINEKKHSNNPNYHVDIYEKNTGKQLAIWNTKAGYKEINP